MWWFFKKKEDRRLDDIKKTMEASFSNVRKDFELLKTAVKNLESYKDDHHLKIDILLDRLDKLDKDLRLSSPMLEAEREPEHSQEQPNLFDTLTEKQKAFCQVLAALHTESPNKWVSLKALAQELYPNHEYSTIRSTVSQYLTHLEELGFVKKKRKGKHAYVIATQLNPFIKSISQLKVHSQIKRKKQKDKND